MIYFQSDDNMTLYMNVLALQMKARNYNSNLLIYWNIKNFAGGII